MVNSYITPCIRCGTARIVSKKWSEKIKTYSGFTLVEYTDTVCPNPECQKVVDKEFAVQKKKRDKMRFDIEQRALTRKRDAQIALANRHK